MELRAKSWGIGAVTDKPAVAILAVAITYLTLDLLLKLVGARVGVGGVQLLGGTLPVNQFGSYVLNGIVLGLVIGLAGVGLSMTYSILNFANFAHGDYVTAGAFSGSFVAYIVAYITTGVDAPFGNIFLITEPSLLSIATTPAAVLLGIVASGAITIGLVLGIDRIVYRPMRDKDGITLLIASIGVALALRYLIAFVFSTATRGVTSTSNLPSVDIPAVDGTVPLDAHEATLVVVAITLMFAVHYLLQRTKLGKAMRAMADNKSLAQVTGIPTERVVRTTWIVGGGLAGVAGFLIMLESGTMGFSMGWRLLLLIFSGVILGGIGSVYGAIGGGLVIGLASRLSLVWLPPGASGFARVIAFLVMIIVLLYRPKGLFSGVTTA